MSPKLTEQQHAWQVAAEQAGRLDKFLVGRLPDYSRARLQTLIREQRVRVDGDAVSKSGSRVEAGQRVELSVPPAKSSSLVPEKIPLDIIFENQDLLVVDKPAGMVVHPAPGHPTGTLMHAALAHAPQIEGVGDEERPGLVHRLDKETSGLILLAKNDKTQRHLQRQFEERQVQKTYLALVDGQPPTPTGRIEAPIGRDPRDRKKMAVVSEGRGREAVSEYRLRESFAKHALMDVDLLTGRTHQIRVHLAFLGTPVVGDTVYGRRTASLSLDRHFLHARQLGIKLPGERVPRLFEAPLPDELQAILDQLKG